MCIVCLKLNDESVSLYDATIMAGEIRASIGEEHYRKLIDTIKILENPPKEPEAETLIDDSYGEEYYYGNYGGSDE